MTLFTDFLKYKKGSFNKKINQSEKDKIIELDKDDVVKEGIFKFKRLQKTGFCTFYTGLSFWNIKSDYFDESRKASRRIREFVRLFIIKDDSDLNNNYLIKQIEEDLKSKTKVFLCYYDDIKNVDCKKDFGIWDEEYVCIVNYDSNNSVTGIKISGRKNDILTAKSWKDELLFISTPIKDINEIDRVRTKRIQSSKVLSSDRYKEFQLKSIELQMAISEKECLGDVVSPDSCKWYHSSWPILRALNVVSTPNWHGSFYIKAVSEYRTKHKHKLNILITATADATILEHIEAGIGNLNNANIWVIDLCQTPLEIARLYAKTRNIRIHSSQIDVLKLIDEGLRPDFFDIISTDAFITRFPDINKKRKLLQEWQKVVKKGGIILTTCRISGQKEEKGDKEEIKNFVKNTLKVFDNYSKTDKSILKYINRELTEYNAISYATNITSYPIEESNLYNLFTTAGFKITNSKPDSLFLKNEVGGEFKPTTYAQIIAEKT